MYCTPDDVKSILGGVEKTSSESWEGTGSDLNDEQIEPDIQDADMQIDSALGKKYTVPFGPDPDNVPIIIRRLSADIAQYLVDMRYRTSREYESQNYPSIMRYNRAKEMLEFIRSGDYIIPDQGAASLNEPLVIHGYPDPPFFTYEEFFYPPELQY